MEIDCAYCEGTGTEPYSGEPCRVCLGRGKLIITYNNPVECAFCKSSGRQPRSSHTKPCQVCKGAGVVPPVVHEY